MLIAAAGPILVASYFDRFGDYDVAMFGVAGAWATAAWIILLARRPLHPSLVEARASA